MATSILSFAGDGVTTDFVFDQGALDVAHLTARVDNVEVDSTITETVKRREFLVSFAVAPAVGENVSIQRNTPVTTRVTHYASAPYDRDTADESFLHRLYILQEALDNFTNADVAAQEFKDQLQQLVDDGFQLVQDNHNTESAARTLQLNTYITQTQAALDAITPNVDAATTTTEVQKHASQLCDLEFAVNNLKATVADLVFNAATLLTRFPYIHADPQYPLVSYWPLHELAEDTYFVDYGGANNHLTTLTEFTERHSYSFVPPLFRSDQLIPTMNVVTGMSGDHTVDDTTFGGISGDFRPFLSDGNAFTIGMNFSIDDDWNDTPGAKVRELFNVFVPDTEDGSEAFAGVPVGYRVKFRVFLTSFLSGSYLEVRAENNGSFDSIISRSLGNLPAHQYEIHASFDTTNRQCVLSIGTLTETGSWDAAHNVADGVPLYLAVASANFLNSNNNTHPPGSMGHYVLLDGTMTALQTDLLNLARNYNGLQVTTPDVPSCTLHTSLGGSNPYLNPAPPSNDLIWSFKNSAVETVGDTTIDFNVTNYTEGFSPGVGKVFNGIVQGDPGNVTVEITPSPTIPDPNTVNFYLRTQADVNVPASTTNGINIVEVASDGVDVHLYGYNVDDGAAFVDLIIPFGTLPQYTSLATALTFLIDTVSVGPGEYHYLQYLEIDDEFRAPVKNTTPII